MEYKVIGINEKNKRIQMHIKFDDFLKTKTNIYENKISQLNASVLAINAKLIKSSFDVINYLLLGIKNYKHKDGNDKIEIIYKNIESEYVRLLSIMESDLQTQNIDLFKFKDVIAFTLALHRFLFENNENVFGSTEEVEYINTLLINILRLFNDRIKWQQNNLSGWFWNMYLGNYTCPSPGSIGEPIDWRNYNINELSSLVLNYSVHEIERK